MNAATVSVLIEAQDKASSVIDNVGSKLGGLPGIATGAVTALAGIGVVAAGGVAAGLGAAVAAASGFEASMSGIKAVSGATAAEMQGLQQKALDLGKATSFSASEAANGIEELIKGGLSIADVMGGGAAAALDLAAAGSINVAEAAEIAANAVGMFGLKGNQLAGVADKIAGAANASALDVTDFKFSMAAAGAVANTIGFSFDDLAVAIAEMGKAGIKGSDAGTSLKTMMLNLQPTTKEQKKLFRELGIVTKDGANQFFDATGKVKNLADVQGVLQKALSGMTDAQRIAALEVMFGSDAIRAGAVLAKEGSEGFNEMAAAMGKVTAASVGAERLNNLKGSFEQLKGSAETAAITVGMALTPALKQLTDAATGLLNNAMPGIEAFAAGVSDAITKVMGGFKTGGFEGAAANIAMLLGFDEDAVSRVLEVVEPIIARIQANIGQIVGGFQTGGVSGAGVNILVHLLGLDEDAAGEAVAAIENIKTQVEGAWNSLVAIFTGGGKDQAAGEMQLATILNEAFGPDVAATIVGTVQAIDGAITTVTATIRGLVSVFQEGGLIAAIQSAFGPEVAAIVSQFLTSAQGALAALGTTLSTQVLPALGQFKDFIGPFLGPVLQTFATMVGVTVVAGILALSAALEAIKFVLENTGTAFSTLGGLADQWKQILELAAKGVGQAFSDLGMKANEIKTQVGQFFADLGSGANSARENVVGSFNNIVSGVQTAMSNMGQAIQGAINGIVSWAGTEAAKIGSAIVNGIGNALSTGIGLVQQKAQELASSIPGPIKALLGISSPSRIMFEIGTNVVQGLINGMESLTRQAAGAAAAVGEKSMAALRAWVEETIQYGDLRNDWLAWIPDQYRDVAEQLIAAVNQYEGSDAAAAFEDWGQNLIDSIAKGFDPAKADQLLEDFSFRLDWQARNIMPDIIATGVSLAEGFQNGWAESMRQFNPQTSFDFLDQRDFDHWQGFKQTLPPLTSYSSADPKVQADMRAALDANSPPTQVRIHPDDLAAIAGHIGRSVRLTLMERG